MWELICIWWPVLPSLVAAASVVAKITPNKTDDKYVGIVLKAIDALAFTTGKTIVLNKLPKF